MTDAGLSALLDSSSISNTDKILAILHHSRTPLKTGQIKEIATRHGAHEAATWNIAAHLASAGKKVVTQVRRQWTLTAKGKERASQVGPTGQSNSAQPTNATKSTGIRVFISHRSTDSAIAEKLVSVLRAALNLPPNQIRCTSVNGARLPGGSDHEEQLRNELLDAPVFIGLITSASFESVYVMFELGARWGSKKTLIPLLAGGVSFQRPPLSSYHPHQLGSFEDLTELVTEVGEALDLEPNKVGSFSINIRELTQLAQPQDESPSPRKKRAKP